MQVSIFLSTRQLLKRIGNIGLDAKVEPSLKVKVRFTNMISCICIVILMGYAIVNIFFSITLAVINFLTLFSLFSVFYFNSIQRFSVAKFIMICSLSVPFAYTNIKFLNSTEYYLVAILAVGTLLFDWNRVWILFILTLFLAIIIPKSISSMQDDTLPLGPFRIIFNSTLGILFLISLIVHLKGSQRRYQTALLQQREELEKSNIVMKRLFAIISHDIQGPLHVARQLSVFLSTSSQDKVPDPKIAETLASELSSLCENVDMLLSWSKNNIEKMIPKPLNFNLIHSMQKIIHELRETASKKNMVIQLSSNKDAYITADRDHLHIVFRNILNNAIKFAFDSTLITIDVTQERYKTYVAITNIGIGIPNHRIGSIFHDIQDPTWGTSGEKGNGLGLMLVYDLLQQNGNEISFESVQGGATCFTVIINQQQSSD